jgi:hypothetical protein
MAGMELNTMQGVEQLTSTSITESPHPHGPGLLQNSIPDLICRHL